MMNLGVLYRSEGKYDQGAILLRKALEERRRTMGNENANTLYSMYQLARLYLEQGNDDQTEPLLTVFLEIRGRASKPAPAGKNFFGIWIGHGGGPDAARPPSFAAAPVF